MALKSFEDQLLARVGEALSGDLGLVTEDLDDTATQVVRNICSKLPSRLLDHMGAETALANSSGATVTTRVLGVTREDANGILRPAREVSHVLEERLEDPDDLVYASPNDPAWFPKNGKVYVKPNPTSSAGAKISALSPPAVDASGDIAITGFPDELEPVVVDGMFIWVKKREMSLSRRDAQAEVGNISAILGSLSTTYDDIETALNAATTEAAKIDEVIVLASAEFDKTPTVLDDADTEINKVPTIIDLVNTAVGRVNVAVQLANTEFDLINTDVDTASTSISTSKHIDQGRAELQVADGRVKTGGAYLQEAAVGIQEAGGYATEAQARLTNAASYIQEAGARGTSGENYIKEASAIVTNVGALLQEAGARIGKAQTYLQESGVRINTSQGYLMQSSGAREEVKMLQEQYDADIKAYVANA